MQYSFAGWWFCLGDMTVFECLVLSSQIVHEENFCRHQIESTVKISIKEAPSLADLYHQHVSSCCWKEVRGNLGVALVPVAVASEGL